MKNQNRILVFLALVIVISTSMFAGKLKGKIIKPGDKGMISIGGGTNIGGTSSAVLRFDANVFFPVYSNQFMSVGFNTSANYNSFNNDFPALPTVYNMANQLTNIAAFVGDVAEKNTGFKLQVGPQVNFYMGDRFIISPIFGLGLTNMYPAREYKAVQTTSVQTTSVDPEIYTYDLLKVKQSATGALCMTPKIRLSYMISPTVGFWTEGSYMISPSVSTQISSLKTEGAPDSKGNYKEQQLAFGSYTTQTVTQSYNAVGINAGITLVLGGGSSERRGIKEGGLKKTEEMEAFRKGWDGTVKGGSIQEKGIQESGIKRTDDSTTPQNKTQAEVKSIAETLVNLCKPDWNGSVKGIAQTQAEVKSIAETLVNVCKPDWDGSVKGIAERKGNTEGGLKLTDETAAQRKGWDGSVKGIAERKGINENGLKLTDDEVSYSKMNDQQTLIKGIDVNGIPFEHLISTGAQSPLYESQNKGENPLYNSQKSATTSCGSVTQKITYPDGKVEELTFACPADAAEFQKLKNGYVRSQTPDSTSAFRKGWDGSVKGSSRGIDKADVRKNAATQRKGWDGSVKGNSKGITEKGLK